MGHPVNRVELPPLPKGEVSYEPSYEILFIENGKSSEVAEEMARRVVVYYDRENESEAVAVRINSAEVVLKPFVDAVLVRRGITPNPNAPQQRHKKGYRETVITQIQRVGWELAPYSEATYDPDRQTLLIEKGDSSTVCREMATDIHILYGQDGENTPWWSAVAIRIDRAETVLKPFVDAILVKYGIKAEAHAQDKADD